MSAQSITVTTGTQVKNYWKKIQGDLATAFAHGKRVERQIYNRLPKFEAAPSQYEVTFPLDLNERGGIASIGDGGYKAKPSSVNAVEATVAPVHFHGQFSISDWSKYSDRGMANQLARQLTTQATQKIDAHVEHFSDYFYGSASALLATTDTDISGTTATLTLAAGYGVAGITNARFLASMFKPGDRIVALDSSNALIDSTDSFGEITAVSKTNGTIGVTFDGSITYSTNGIRLYKANNIEGTTAAGGSDLNRGLNGFIDGFTATSVHSVSGSTYPNWNAAYSDTNAGSFTFAKLRRAKDEIMNSGGLMANECVLSQGVYRNMMVQERAGLRYDDASALSFDGDVKAKGMTFTTSKNVPPGYVFVYGRDAINQWEILPTTDRPMWGDLLESDTLTGATGRVDWFGNIIWKNRSGLAYFTNQTES